MEKVKGRVTFLPKQIRRLAELSRDNPGAIEVRQNGSVLHINTCREQVSINAHGVDIHPENQEKLC